MAADTPAAVTFQFVAPVASGPDTLEGVLADPTYNKGRELVKGGKFDEAIGLFEARTAPKKITKIAPLRKQLFLAILVLELSETL